MSMLDHTLKPEGTSVRRLEVITGTGRRRRFSTDDKARIVEETLSPGAVVSEVARRHGLTPQQLFGWRREARRALNETGEAPARFVPAAPGITARFCTRAEQSISEECLVVEAVTFEPVSRVKFPGSRELAGNF